MFPCKHILFVNMFTLLHTFLFINQLVTKNAFADFLR